MSLLLHLKDQIPFLFRQGFIYFHSNNLTDWELGAFLLFSEGGTIARLFSITRADSLPRLGACTFFFKFKLNLTYFYSILSLIGR